MDVVIKNVNIALTRKDMRDVNEDEDIMLAVGTVDELEDILNRMAMKLRDWYSIHFPELDRMVENHKIYAQLVCKFKLRKNFSQGKSGLDKTQEETIINASKDSLGSDWDEFKIEPVVMLAEEVVLLFEKQEKIEEYILKRMRTVAPNICELAGPMLGARLITLSHGLERLSTLPSGTIQIMGAEDAFFRFLKTGKRPPKHGVIFQLPEIRSAPPAIRGKIARTFASKLAIASRTDFFKGKFIGDKLKESFQKRINSL